LGRPRPTQGCSAEKKEKKKNKNKKNKNKKRKIGSSLGSEWTTTSYLLYSPKFTLATTNKHLKLQYMFSVCCKTNLKIS